jgi:malonate transporter and related proteins
VLAPMLAVPFVLTDIGLPESLIKSLSLMGEVASGAALFLTGLILSAQKVRLGASGSSDARGTIIWRDNFNRR